MPGISFFTCQWTRGARRLRPREVQWLLFPRQNGDFDVHCVPSPDTGSLGDHEVRSALLTAILKQDPAGAHICHAGRPLAHRGTIEHRGHGCFSSRLPSDETTPVLPRNASHRHTILPPSYSDRGVHASERRKRTPPVQPTLPVRRPARTGHHPGQCRYVARRPSPGTSLTSLWFLPPTRGPVIHVMCSV
jgi:hypothetical protein